jgi:hypothetical protein
MSYTSRFKIFSMLFMLALSWTFSAHATSKSKFCKVMLDWNESRQEASGEKICRDNNGSFCTGASIGEGICRANNGSFCTGASIGEGICRANNGSFCTGASIGEGLCRAVNGSFCTSMSEDEAWKLVGQYCFP